MKLEQYELAFERTKTNFDFISEGPKGRILKTVRFTKIKVKSHNNLYNLAFGDKNPDSGAIDDLGTLKKQLITVIRALQARLL